MIEEARARGLDVTTECYPYTAGMTDLASGVFDDGWREALGIDYRDLLWAATGERLTAETFAERRRTGGMVADLLDPGGRGAGRHRPSAGRSWPATR